MHFLMKGLNHIPVAFSCGKGGRAKMGFYFASVGLMQGKAYMFMMRTKQPAGVVSNQLYLTMDDLADEVRCPGMARAPVQQQNFSLQVVWQRTSGDAALR